MAGSELLMVLWVRGVLLFCVVLVRLGPGQQATLVKGPGSGLLFHAPSFVASEEARTSLEPGVVKALQPLSVDREIKYVRGTDGSAFAVLHVQAEGAAAVRLHFEDLRLPAGSSLYVYGADFQPHGPYVSSGPLRSGEFWTRAVAGSNVYVEVQTAGDPPPQLPFTLREAALVEVPEAPLAEEIALPPSWAAVKWRGQMVLAQDRGGALLFEDDIVVDAPIAPLVPQNGTRSFGVSFTTSLWPGGLLPYTIDPALPNISRVTAAVQHWNTALAGYVKLVPRTSETNYVQFAYNSSAGSCFSSVGRTGGLQYINLGDYCSTGNVIHEIGHTLGLWHEHTRPDRDTKVIVHSENIDPLYSYNFNLQSYNAKSLGSYDYSSIMHYSAYAFSVNGGPTIETIPAGIAIGQRNSLSAGDIAGAQSLYPAATSASHVSITIATALGGQTVVVDGVSMLAPQTLFWVPGSTHTFSASSVTLGGGGRYVFSSWNPGGNSASQTVVTPGTATTYTATYVTQYLVAAGVSPSGTGAITISPASGDGYYAANSSLSLTATASPGYCFNSWTGLAASSATAALTVDKSYAVVANMSPSYLSVDRFSSIASADGLNGQVNVNTSAGCRWSATTQADWILLDNPGNRLGSGVLTFFVTPNSTGLWRFGAIRIGTNSIAVVQSN